MDTENRALMQHSSAQQNPSSESASRRAKEALIAAHLSKLALHYFRPDMAENHVKSILEDFVDDLGGFEGIDIAEACRSYRRNEANKGFPKPGQLMKLATESRKDRSGSSTRNYPQSVANPVDFNKVNRPIFWWALPKKFWKAEWSEDDIPQEWRANYDKLRRKA